MNETIKNLFKIHPKDWIPALVICLLMTSSLFLIGIDKVCRIGNDLFFSTFKGSPLWIFFVEGYYPGYIAFILTMLLTPLRSFWKISIISSWVLFTISGNLTFPCSLSNEYTHTDMQSLPGLGITKFLFLFDIDSILFTAISIFIIKKGLNKANQYISRKKN